jgi:surfactin synthase thioesterase subunit
MYRTWLPLLPDGVELCAMTLPGRESRFDEPIPVDLDELMSVLTSAALPLLDDLPTVFFGHSLGALLAFDLSRRLRGLGVCQPHHLIVSGCRPPHVTYAGVLVSEFTDSGLVDELRRLNGTAEEILANPAALDLLLPVLRADFRLSERYLCHDLRSLTCPITALAGVDDLDTRPVDLHRWAEQTSGPFELRWLPGDHFYLETARPMVVAAAAQALLPYLLG